MAEQHAMQDQHPGPARPSVPMPEFILCIPGPTAVPAGLTPLGSPDDLGRYFNPARMVLVPRSVDETDPEGIAFKQLVAYVVLVRGLHVFAYRRIPGTGEPDLAGRRSVGLGGHVNAEDVIDSMGDIGSVLDWAAWREVAEEVENQIKGCGPIVSVRPVALLYDPSNAVGRRHVGVVYRAPVEDRFKRVVSLRPGLEPLGWQTPGEVLGGDGPPLEPWSKIVLEHLEPLERWSS